MVLKSLVRDVLEANKLSIIQFKSITFECGNQPEFSRAVLRELDQDYKDKNGWISYFMIFTISDISDTHALLLQSISKENMFATAMMGCLLKAHKTFAQSQNHSEEAVGFWTIAAEKDNVFGLANLGNVYFEKQDYDKAFKFYLRASSLLHPQSMHMLGVMHFQGLGCIKNDEESFQWLEECVKVDSKFKPALYGLGILSVDEKQKFDYFDRAAELGHVKSQEEIQKPKYEMWKLRKENQKLKDRVVELDQGILELQEFKKFDFNQLFHSTTGKYIV